MKLSCSRGNCYHLAENNEFISLRYDFQSLENYTQIHSLYCDLNTTCSRRGKLRFGQKIGDGGFSMVFPEFQNHNTTQNCTCFLCKCENNMCRKRRWLIKLKIANWGGGRRFHRCDALASYGTSSLVDELNTTPTTVPEATDGSSSLVDELNTTPTTVPEATDGVPTMAIIGGLIALALIISGTTVLVCLRRKRYISNKRPLEYSESCITNQSYRDTQDVKEDSGQDNAGYEELERNDVHDYDIVDDPKFKTPTEEEYSYANFGRRPQLQGPKSTPDQEKCVDFTKDSHHQETKTAFQTDNGQSYIRNEPKVPCHNDDYDLAKLVTNSDDYFKLEKTGQNSLEAKDNDVNEHVEAMQGKKEPISPEEHNYFLLEGSSKSLHNQRSVTKETTAITGTGNKEIPGIQTDNYFLLEEPNHTKTTDMANGGYSTFAQSTSQHDGKYERKFADKSGEDLDPYDHMRVGHAQTNAMDDGAYDELRKQNHRYESENDDNDYDHC
ncbi:uncharacterized protein LOC132559941 [Ylistrum balloti]|uniref:uncharacterized protein LOC132559941 n=1 Tax=Ylistrum balloti TaxID=509963 RepID=UPI002905DBA5|nr:uncharacterized protein LOC132559941 [Ylistrum balloti]